MKLLFAHIHKGCKSSASHRISDLRQLDKQPQDQDKTDVMDLELIGIAYY
jgi:hypothetical protein